jgi:hypothetical protein
MAEHDSTEPREAADEHTRISLAKRFTEVRKQTMALVLPLEVEDFVVQSMPDASPTKWHMAHTTWFFETFVLAPFLASYKPHNEQYSFLFNSYYLQVGKMHARERRGVLSRPTVSEVTAYRLAVDAQVSELLANAAASDWEEISRCIVLGLNHEQQHQELLLMDIKHVLSCNPMKPAYESGSVANSGSHHQNPAMPLLMNAVAGGVVTIGFEGPGFAFGNEGPRIKPCLQIIKSQIAASRTVSLQSLSQMVAIKDPICGSPTVGGQWSPRSGKRGSIGSKSQGVGTSLRCVDYFPSLPTRLLPMSATTKRMPTHAGPVPACPQRLSGNMQIAQPRSQGTS